MTGPRGKGGKEARCTENLTEAEPQQGLCLKHLKSENEARADAPQLVLGRKRGGRDGNSTAGSWKADWSSSAT